MEDVELKNGDLIEHRSELFWKLYNFWYTFSSTWKHRFTPQDKDEEFLFITGVRAHRFAKGKYNISHPYWSFTVEDADKLFLWRMSN